MAIMSWELFLVQHMVLLSLQWLLTLSCCLACFMDVEQPINIFPWRPVQCLVVSSVWKKNLRKESFGQFRKSLFAQTNKNFISEDFFQSGWHYKALNWVPWKYVNRSLNIQKDRLNCRSKLFYTAISQRVFLIFLLGPTFSDRWKLIQQNA